ncbi:hypothetical protein M2171_007658 [Bradyrhizobium japonicum USDA 38]|nr:hypothetical protein [Bradyrhizobium japonicum USDA 38]MCS3941578.1 hypothetical protein [Bradyrhizobium japonicum]
MLFSLLLKAAQKTQKGPASEEAGPMIPGVSRRCGATRSG